MEKFISFKNWIYENENPKRITGKLNRHMTHAEDLVILGGPTGLKWVIDMFKNLYNVFKGHTTKDKIKLSIKFDGAPSIFVWEKFSGLEKSGVAIKGLFAKDPKVMFSEEDIDKFYSDQPSLANKLKLFLKYVPSLGIPQGQIWQGDFLFDKDSLIKEDGYYSFHPNTIVYKVKKDSDIGKKIEKADVGVVWHTRYTGSSLENIRAQYDTKVSELKENPKVFMIDPYVASFAGIITLTKDENNQISIKIKDIEENAKILYKNPQYKEIIKNVEFIKLFAIFQNFLIKQNEKVENPEEFLDKFAMFIIDRFKKEEETKKTDKGKEAIIQKQNDMLNKIESNSETLKLIISLIIDITKLKKIFITKLNNINKFDNYLKTRSGKFLTTGEEGFAVSDIAGNIVKLVDRFEFSYANFSPDIIKGWSK